MLPESKQDAELAPSVADVWGMAERVLSITALRAALPRALAAGCVSARETRAFEYSWRKDQKALQTLLEWVTIFTSKHLPKPRLALVTRLDNTVDCKCNSCLHRIRTNSPRFLKVKARFLVRLLARLYSNLLYLFSRHIKCSTKNLPEINVHHRDISQVPLSTS